MGNVLLRLLTVSLYASAVLCCILLFRRVFLKSLSANLRYALWGLFVLRLLLPVTFESGLHLSPLDAAQRLFARDTAANAAAVPAEVDAAPFDIAQPYPVWVNPPSATAPAAEEGAPVTGKSGVNWALILFSAYLLGAAGFAALTLSARRRYIRSVLTARVPENALQSACFARCRAEAGCKGNVELIVTRRRVSPALLPYRGRAALVLPASLTEESGMKYAMLHELSHYRRRDHLVLMLLSALRCVYFFQPLVHLGLLEMRSDMETACDASVLASLPAREKRGYLLTLLSLSSAARSPVPALAEFSGKTLAKRRIQGAFLPRRSRFPARFAGATLAALLLLGCFTTACTRAPAAEDAPSAPEATAAQPAERAALSVRSDGEAVSVTDAAGTVHSFAFTDRGVSSESASAPRGAVVGAQKAAEHAAARLVSVFGGEVSDCAVNVFFQNHDEADVAAEHYALYFDGAGYSDAAFFCLVDASTGHVLKVENLYRGNVLPLDESASAVWDGLDADAVQQECMDGAKSLVARAFPGQGEVLADSYTDGMQSVRIGSYVIANDCYLHMERGDCYMVRMLYPGAAVQFVEAYPGGWDYCMEGTWYPEYMVPPTDDGAPTVSNGTYEVRQTDGSVLTEKELADFAEIARSRVGTDPRDYPGPLYLKFHPNKSSFSSLFIESCLETMGYRINGSDGTAVKSADDPALFTGCRLGFNYGDTGNEFMGVYVGNGRYVYGRFETGLIEEGDLAADFASFSSVRAITTEVYAPNRGFPSAEDERVASAALQSAEALRGQAVLLPDGETRNVETLSRALLETAFGTSELATGEQIEIWDVSDASLLPGKELFFISIQSAVENVEKLRRYGIVLGGSRYLSVDPDTGRVREYDLADDLADGAYGAILCCAMFPAR